MVKAQPQLIFLPDEICTDMPVFVTFHPQCHPSTLLAYDLTWFAVPVHIQLVPQPIRSPCWQVDQIVFWPEPVLAPHQLLLIQYLPSEIDAPLVVALVAWAAGVHETLLGSMHPPNRHCVLAPQTVPHLPQFWGSVNTALQAPLQATWSVGHWHTPVTQVAPDAQTLPQVPQFVLVDMTS